VSVKITGVPWVVIEEEEGGPEGLLLGSLSRVEPGKELDPEYAPANVIPGWRPKKAFELLKSLTV
jgi:hypothetical protein